MTEIYSSVLQFQEIPKRSCLYPGYLIIHCHSTNVSLIIFN